MGRIDASTVVQRFKSTFDEASLNALGKATRLCRREREATPYRLMLALLECIEPQRVDRVNVSGPVGFLVGAAAAGIGFALMLGLSLLMFLPLRAVCALRG